MSVPPLPFVFAIPLRSAQVAADWRRTTALLQATLRSVLAQTDPDFHVLTACHETPDLPEIADPRVSVLVATTPPPADFDAQIKDKGTKRKMMLVELRRRGGGLIMLADADDLVSRRIVAHARSTGARHGCLVDQGYVYNAATGSCRLHPAFDQVCGTSAVLRFDPDDLPRSIDDPIPRLSWQYRNHKTFRADAEQLERPLCAVPFPAAMYITGHGENASRFGMTPGLKDRAAPAIKLLNRLLHRGRPAAGLGEEFGFAERNY